jgi:hypothetical protein
VKYLTIRELLETAPEELLAVKKSAHTGGPIATVLDKMHPEGYWEKPVHGYYPEYSGTVWSVILLA